MRSGLRSSSNTGGLRREHPFAFLISRVFGAERTSQEGLEVAFRRRGLGGLEKVKETQGRDFPGGRTWRAVRAGGLGSRVGPPRPGYGVGLRSRSHT